MVYMGDIMATQRKGKIWKSAGSGKSKMLQPVTGCFLVELLVIGGLPSPLCGKIRAMLGFVLC